MWQKLLLPLASIGLILPLGLTIEPSFSAIEKSNSVVQEIPNAWEIAQAFKSPNRGAPPSAGGGGTRGTCEQDPEDAYYVPLSPIGQVGLTVSEYPTFFMYVPEAPARTIQLSILARKDENTEEPVTSVTFTTPRKAGIISISIPTNPKNSLKVGQLYRWEMEIICNRIDRSGNAAMEGFIERVSKDGIDANLANAKETDLPTIYAERGIWYESLASALKLRAANPNNPKVMADWEKLLTSVNLNPEAENADDRPNNKFDVNKIVKADILNCCTPENNSSSPQ